MPFPKSGPFPQPALPGVFNPTDLSAGPDRSPRISGLASADRRQSFPCRRVFHLPCMPAPMPRRKRPGASVACFPARRWLLVFRESAVKEGMRWKSWTRIPEYRRKEPNPGLTRNMDASSFLRRFGSRIESFEACPAFTRVPAFMAAEPPNAAHCQLSASTCIVTTASRFGRRPKRQLPGGFRTLIESAPFHGALQKSLHTTIRSAPALLGGLPAGAAKRIFAFLFGSGSLSTPLSRTPPAIPMLQANAA